MFGWDTETNSYDEDESDGRSYISAVSEVLIDGQTDCEGAAKNEMGEARMDISKSEIAYIGYKDSESYGLTWKVRPCFFPLWNGLTKSFDCSSRRTIRKGTNCLVRIMKLHVYHTKECMEKCWGVWSIFVYFPLFDGGVLLCIGLHYRFEASVTTRAIRKSSTKSVRALRPYHLYIFPPPLDSLFVWPDLTLSDPYTKSIHGMWYHFVRFSPS